MADFGDYKLYTVNSFKEDSYDLFFRNGEGGVIAIKEGKIVNTPDWNDTQKSDFLKYVQEQYPQKRVEAIFKERWEVCLNVAKRGEFQKGSEQYYAGVLGEKNFHLADGGYFFFRLSEDSFECGSYSKDHQLTSVDIGFERNPLASYLKSAREFFLPEINVQEFLDSGDPVVQISKLFQLFDFQTTGFFYNEPWHGVEGRSVYEDKEQDIRVIVETDHNEIVVRVSGKPGVVSLFEFQEEKEYHKIYDALSKVVPDRKPYVDKKVQEAVSLIESGVLKEKNEYGYYTTFSNKAEDQFVSVDLHEGMVTGFQITSKDGGTEFIASAYGDVYDSFQPLMQALKKKGYGYTLVPRDFWK